MISGKYLDILILIFLGIMFMVMCWPLLYNMDIHIWYNIIICINLQNFSYRSHFSQFYQSKIFPFFEIVWKNFSLVTDLFQKLDFNTNFVNFVNKSSGIFDKQCLRDFENNFPTKSYFKLDLFI